MAINKVQFGNQTLIDLTSDTVTADKLMQGYTAHDRTGALITGTATGGGSGGNVWQDAQGYVHLDDEGTAPITVESLSVTQNGTYTATTGHAYSPVTVNVSGGGGLEYETGTWTPSEDAYTYNISFSNAHTKAPFYVIMIDATETYSDVTQSNYVFEFIDFGQVLGFLYVSGTVLRYGYAFQMNRATNVTALSNGLISNLQYPSTDSSSSSAAYPRYWVTESRFRAYTNSSSRYWRSGRTYKWIAVWAPTA